MNIKDVNEYLLKLFIGVIMVLCIYIGYLFKGQWGKAILIHTPYQKVAVMHT